MGNLRIESFAGVNLLILKWLSVDIDEKYKPTAITANCGLHPLIHTSPPKTLAQDSGVGQKGVDSLKMVSAVSSQSG